MPIVRLSVMAVGLALVAFVLLRGVDVRAAVDQGMGFIRQAGPGVFFSAMAVLPGVGVPLSFFTIPAGEAFGAQLGMFWVIVVSMGAIAVNLTVGYWLSRYALRPVLVGLLARYDYRVPVVTEKNALQVALLVRLTPGPPYALQTAILGVAEVPYRLYMFVSWLAVLPWAVGAIVLGKGLFNGNIAALLAGIGVIVAALIVVQWIRRKYARRED